MLPGLQLQIQHFVAQQTTMRRDQVQVRDKTMVAKRENSWNKETGNLCAFYSSLVIRLGGPNYSNKLRKLIRSERITLAALGIIISHMDIDRRLYEVRARMLT